MINFKCITPLKELFYSVPIYLYFFIAIGLFATPVYSAGILLQRDTTTIFSFGDDASQWYINGVPQHDSTPPTHITGFSIQKDTTTLLWTSNDTVYIKGHVALSQDSALSFTNDSTTASVRLTHHGDLSGVEPNLVKVDLYDDDYVAQNGIENNSFIEYFGFSEGRIEYTSSSATHPILRFYLKDHLGSVRAVETDQGEQTEVVNYDAYGAIIRDDMTAGYENKAKEKFTGKENDSAGVVQVADLGLSLDYFGARYYDPETGTWCGPDQSAQFWNPYGYANNPVSYVDPDGREIIEALVIAIVAAYLVKSLDNAINKNMGWSGFDITNWNQWANSGVGIGADNEGNATININGEQSPSNNYNTQQQIDQQYQQSMDQFNWNLDQVSWLYSGETESPPYILWNTVFKWSANQYAKTDNPAYFITGITSGIMLQVVPKKNEDWGLMTGGLKIGNFNMPNDFHLPRTGTKATILRDAEGYRSVVGDNPDIGVQDGLIILKGRGPTYKGKIYYTKLPASWYFDQ